MSTPGRSKKRQNHFIRDQFDITDPTNDDGTFQIVCRHCGQMRTWMHFNATIATKHILEQCPLVSETVKAEAVNQTQKARRLERGAEDGKDDDENVVKDEEDGEGGGEGVGTPQKRPAAAAAAKNHGATHSGKRRRGGKLVTIAKDELHELLGLKEKVAHMETAKMEAEKAQRETDAINARINMASNLLEKRQTLLDKGVPKEDIDKLLPLSLIEKEEERATI